ncbi:MAG: cytochrome c-type biogenesis protein CcmH [Parvularculaceae bacterium]|nr:cytochrome c-type biogenesis protein CcmH [Parvularculaceae bacterium]
MIFAALLFFAASLTPEQQARADEVYETLRCVACQNQSIAESEAEIAQVMRSMVDNRIAAGDTDEQARQFVVTHYGEYVLLTPSVSPKNYLLWIGPVTALAFGGFWAFSLFRRDAKSSE